MFSLKKNKPTKTIFSPCSGVVKRIETVNDPVFSAKLMGDGFAVLPIEGNIYSPIKGKVTTVFPTKHAICLITEEGIEVLVHMGIDTVVLKGVGFKLFVEENQEVDVQTLLAKVDLNVLKLEHKETDILIVFTNLKSNQKCCVTSKHDVLNHQQIGEIK